MAQLTGEAWRKHEWLPEVELPGDTGWTDFPATGEDGREYMFRLVPATDEEVEARRRCVRGLKSLPHSGVWLVVKGGRYFVTDEALAYALAGARKARGGVA